jgi:hypothetical protein
MKHPISVSIKPAAAHRGRTYRINDHSPNAGKVKASNKRA